MPHRDIKPAHLGEGSAQKQTKHLKDPLDNTVAVRNDCRVLARQRGKFGPV